MAVWHFAVQDTVLLCYESAAYTEMRQRLKLLSAMMALLIAFAGMRILPAQAALGNGLLPGIARLSETAGDYILPESDSRYYTESEIRALPEGLSRFARNEIFARHGMCFRSDDLAVFFYARSWYHPISGLYSDNFDQSSLFNSFEKYNVDLINAVESGGAIPQPPAGAQTQPAPAQPVNVPQIPTDSQPAVITTQASQNATSLTPSEIAAKVAELNAGGGTQATSINIYEENYAPGARNYHAVWDRNLFYTLEDTDPNSGADGKINGYSVSRTSLTNAVNGNRIDYEIYRAPGSRIVNKIVSIEYVNNYLEITDYYYDNNAKVSFIFQRTDSNYIPTYATPEKDGQRFYFSGDCMVKWRQITGNSRNNFIISSEEAAQNAVGTITMYSAMDAGSQASFDTMERRMINAAYNTYRVLLSVENINRIVGYVFDQNAAALPGATVTLIYNGMQVYQTATGVDGSYAIAVPGETTKYNIQVSKEQYRTETIYAVEVSAEVINISVESVYLIPLALQSTTVAQMVEVRDAVQISVDNSGTVPVGEALVCVREGVNNRDGEVVAAGYTNGNGQLMLVLKPAMYTVQVAKAGYADVFKSFSQREGADTVHVHFSPTLPEGELRIVLTWGAVPADLDSHLFTPYNALLGDDNYHIWYSNQNDGAGNNLDVDDTTSYGPETVTIPQVVNGLYKYYVCDYTNCVANRSSSYEMSYSGAVVNVYGAQGLIASFNVPTGMPGVVWEVFEIRDGVIVPNQRYYSNVGSTDWWNHGGVN